MKIIKFAERSLFFFPRKDKRFSENLFFFTVFVTNRCVSPRRKEFFFSNKKISRCFRGSRLWSTEEFFVAGHGTCAFSKRVFELLVTGDCARIMMGVSVDNTYIQRWGNTFPNPFFPKCTFPKVHYSQKLFFPKNAFLNMCPGKFLKMRLPRTLGRHGFSLTIHEVSGNWTRDVVNYRPVL